MRIERGPGAAAAARWQCPASSPVHAAAASSHLLLQLIHGRGFVKEVYVHSRLRDTLVSICTTRVKLKLGRISKSQY